MTDNTDMIPRGFRSIHKQTCEKCKHSIKLTNEGYKTGDAHWLCELNPDNIFGEVKNSGFIRPSIKDVTCEIWEAK